MILFFPLVKQRIQCEFYFHWLPFKRRRPSVFSQLIFHAQCVPLLVSLFAQPKNPNQSSVNASEFLNTFADYFSELHQYTQGARSGNVMTSN